MYVKIQKFTPQRKLFFIVQLFVGLGLLLLVRTIYFNHPYFRGYFPPAAYYILENLFWLLCGIWIADSLIKSLFVAKLPVTSASILFVYIASVYRSIKDVLTGKVANINIVPDRNTKVALLGLLVKFIFFPVMLFTTVTNAGLLSGDLEKLIAGQYTFEFQSVYSTLINLIFLIDTLIFGFAYIFEAKWLRNQIKSVEPTLLGWMAALLTYPPFNIVMVTFFPLDRMGPGFVTDINLMHAIQIGVIIFHLIFLSASISLGTRATNLTNRGIVFGGTYRFVRHPAYVAKLVAWFLEGFIIAAAPSYWLFWIGWAGVYSLRAWTEERHLSMDPDYLKYKDKVKWAAIPGVF